MSELGNQIVSSARKRVELPFRHHFKPANLCEGGARTVDGCMGRGMDSRGYDCSGLAIASICDVLNISTQEWPREWRHTQQLASLAIDAAFKPGDLRLYYSDTGRIHLGIATSTEKVVHASGLTNIVEESVVVDPSGSFEAIKTIATGTLLGVLMSRN